MARVSELFCVCLDVNECQTLKGVCINGRCRNTQGSFVCVCQPGYYYNAERMICDGNKSTFLLCIFAPVCPIQTNPVYLNQITWPIHTHTHTQCVYFISNSEVSHNIRETVQQRCLGLFGQVARLLTVIPASAALSIIHSQHCNRRSFPYA